MLISQFERANRNTRSQILTMLQIVFHQLIESIKHCNLLSWTELSSWQVQLLTSLLLVTYLALYYFKLRINNFYHKFLSNYYFIALLLLFNIITTNPSLQRSITNYTTWHIAITSKEDTWQCIQSWKALLHYRSLISDFARSQSL